VLVMLLLLLLLVVVVVVDVCDGAGKPLSAPAARIKKFREQYNIINAHSRFGGWLDWGSAST